VPPSGGRASLQLFSMATQTKNKKMIYKYNSSSCFDILQHHYNYLLLALSVASQSVTKLHHWWAESKLMPCEQTMANFYAMVYC